MTFTRLFAALFVLSATAAWLPAHGGQYRGPWNGPPTPPVPGTPTTGGGPMPPSGGPTTGGRPGVSDGTSWQVWWEFAKDPLILPPAGQDRGPVSGSDEYYLGPRRSSGGGDALAPTAADRKDKIAAALLQALHGEQNRDITTACLVALAKVGVDPPGASLRDVFAGYVGDADQEVRETAVLAFGIAGRDEAIDLLAGLLQQTAAGKKLAAATEVPERTRTFAAWSLGLLAHRTADVVKKQRVHDLLLPVLRQPDERSRDLRVGVIQGLGLLGTDGERSAAEKRLLWRTVDELWDYYGKDLGKGDQLIQAHVPTAVARLLGRGNSSEHQRAKALLAEELTGTRRRHNAIHQSAALGLGLLCLPPEQSADDAAYTQVLLHCYQKAQDQLARFFAALALGRIGGEQNRKALLSAYEGSNKTIERPWLALALGLIARQRAAVPGGAVDEEVGRLLLRDVQAIEFEDAQAAFALALGLCRYQDAADALERLFYQRNRSETRDGYVAVALAMLDHKQIADHLVEVMQRSIHKPFLLLQCAVALGRLGDARAVPTLQEMLGKCDTMAGLSAVATAIGQIGDRRSIDPLIAAMLDQQKTKLARAYAAAALGGVGDKDPVPWNSQIASDTNYMATVDTLTNGATGVLDIL